MFRSKYKDESPDNPYTLIEIRPSKVHGRGVFAKYSIPKGRIFSCEIMVISDAVKMSTTFKDHTYPYEGKRASCVCMGFGSFFNHSDNPNMQIHKLDKVRMVKTFIALRDIKPDEELFLYYNDQFSVEMEWHKSTQG